MINLKTKDLYEKITFWKSFALYLINFTVGIIFFISFFLFFNLNLYFLILNISLCIVIVELVINMIWEIYVLVVLRKKAAIELLEIMKKTKLPEKLPKVVFVYTTHNDFWESRFLQCINQTYTNIEFWISDGSSNENIRKNIKDFCEKNKINYFSWGKPSINKADNLNHFLKGSGAKFDYLLITDADVAMDKNFVLSSMKLFYYQDQKRLGWISPKIINYKENNFFNNIFYSLDNTDAIFKNESKNFIMSSQVNLCSATALIKREMLEDFNMEFPDSCLEDTWLEWLATKKIWYGLNNHLSISMQAYDKNILMHFNRIFRIFDWTVKIFKENFFKKWNEEKTDFYKETFNEMMNYFLMYIMLPIAIALVITFSINNFSDIYSQQIFKNIVINFIISIFLSIIFFFIKNIPTFKWRILILPFLLPIYLISYFWLKSIRFFNSFFRSKYADFSPSRSKKSSSRKFPNLIKMKNYLWILLLTSVILISINLSFILTNTYYLNVGFLFLFIYFNILFGSIWLSLFSFFVLYLLSLIKTNKKYNRDDFVYCENKFIKKEKIIKKWCQLNKTTFEEILK